MHVCVCVHNIAVSGWSWRPPTCLQPAQLSQPHIRTRLNPLRSNKIKHTLSNTQPCNIKTKSGFGSASVVKSWNMKALLYGIYRIKQDKNQNPLPTFQHWLNKPLIGAIKDYLWYLTFTQMQILINFVQQMCSIGGKQSLNCRHASRQWPKIPRLAIM